MIPCHSIFKVKSVFTIAMEKCPINHNDSDFSNLDTGETWMESQKNNVILLKRRKKSIRQRRETQVLDVILLLLRCIT